METDGEQPEDGLLPDYCRGLHLEQDIRTKQAADLHQRACRWCGRVDEAIAHLPKGGEVRPDVEEIVRDLHDVRKAGATACKGPADVLKHLDRLSAEIGAADQLS